MRVGMQIDGIRTVVPIQIILGGDNTGIVNKYQLYFSYPGRPCPEAQMGASSRPRLQAEHLRKTAGFLAGRFRRRCELAGHPPLTLVYYHRHEKAARRPHDRFCPLHRFLRHLAAFPGQSGSRLLNLSVPADHIPVPQATTLDLLFLSSNGKLLPESAGEHYPGPSPAVIWTSRSRGMSAGARSAIRAGPRISSSSRNRSLATTRADTSIPWQTGRTRRRYPAPISRSRSAPPKLPSRQWCRATATCRTPW